MPLQLKSGSLKAGDFVTKKELESLSIDLLALLKLKQQLNRLASRNGREDVFAQKAISTERKKRTRTLIQVGGLLKILNLLDYIGIQEGEDLQLDPLAHEKATMLLGLLSSLTEHIPPTPTQADFAHWKTLGKIKFGS